MTSIRTFTLRNNINLTERDIGRALADKLVRIDEDAYDIKVRVQSHLLSRPSFTSTATYTPLSVYYLKQCIKQVFDRPTGEIIDIITVEYSC